MQSLQRCHEWHSLRDKQDAAGCGGSLEDRRLVLRLSSTLFEVSWSCRDVELSLFVVVLFDRLGTLLALLGEAVEASWV